MAKKQKKPKKWSKKKIIWNTYEAINSLLIQTNYKRAHLICGTRKYKQCNNYIAMLNIDNESYLEKINLFFSGNYPEN